METNYKTAKKSNKVFFFIMVSMLLAFLTTLIFVFSETLSLRETINIIITDWLETLGLFLIITIVLVIFILFQFHTNKPFVKRKRNILVILVAVLLALVLELITTRFLSEYCTPILFCTIIVLTLIDKNTAYAINTALLMFSALVGAYFGDASIIMFKGVVYLSGVLMVYMLSGKESRLKFALASFLTEFLIFPIGFIAFFVIGQGYVDALVNSLYLVAGMCIAVALHMLFLPIFEWIFNICTDIKLNEYCSFRSPLLKKMSEDAPGTFSHCLMVGNLAENCALAIGENPILARTCAYYHDVGKIKSPEFFAENQKTVNPHDELIPEVSVKKIVCHTTNGYELLRKFRFPQEICDSAIQHHGTTPLKYFYDKANIITEGKANIQDYSYTGPKPTTKINAIIMICDAAEAAVRAVGWREDMHIVKKIIKERIDLEQFTDCPITFEDLAKIEETLSVVLAGLYHSRISYKPRL